MTKIANKLAYKVKSPLALSDYAIGTNSESGIPGFALGQSISIELNTLRNLFIAGLSPEVGGNLKITEIEYSGVLTSVSAVANALDPAYQVSQYELLVFNVNGNKYILKEQNIAIGVGEDNLADSDFINMLAFVKLGDGTAILKGYNEATGNWEFYAIKSTGNDVSVVDGDVVIDPKEGTNLGASGVAIYKGLNATTKLHEFYKIDSDDFSVTLEDDIVKINNISTTDARTFYVNSGYDIDGSAPETGSLGKPYKTIAGAITAYIGTTGDAQDPQFKNSDIIVQKGAGYTFTGDFILNMGAGNIVLEEGAIVVSNPNTDWLCDYDTLSDTEIATINIILKEDSRLILQKNGFRNRGTSVDNSAFVDYKKISISGTGEVFQSSTSLTNSYVMFESNYTTNDTYNNDGAIQIDISGVVVVTNTQSIYKIGGNSQIAFTGCSNFYIQALTGLSTSTVFCNQIGGVVTILNTNISVSPFFAITLDKVFPISKTVGIPSTLRIDGCLIGGRMTTLISNETSEESTVNISNISSQTGLLVCTNIAKSPSVLWTKFIAFNSIFVSGVVDQTQVDLTAGNTISTTNIFNSKVVESLQVFGSRALAVAGGLQKGNAFINRKTITAGNFVPGVEYQIVTTDTTDFTLIGASANTVGLNFTATGTPFTLVGTGTGTAYQHTIDILI